MSNETKTPTWTSVNVNPKKSGEYTVIILTEEATKSSSSIYEGKATYNNKRWEIDGGQTNQKVVLWRNKE